MIPAHDIDNPRNYAYVAGCRNAAWLVGRVHEIDHENRCLLITRSGEDELISANLEGGDRIPADMKIGDAIKLICHIYSRAQDDDDTDLKAGRYSRLVIKHIGRPNLLDMRPSESFAKMDLDANPEVFGSFDLPSALTPVSNKVELAGFVSHREFIRDKEHGKDRLTIFLRQASSVRHTVPVEIRGRHAAHYYKTATVGAAVHIEDGIVLAARRPDTNEIIPLIRANHVSQANPDKDFKFDQVPDWAVDIRRRAAALAAQERSRIAALAAARQAENMLED